MIILPTRVPHFTLQLHGEKKFLIYISPESSSLPISPITKAQVNPPPIKPNHTYIKLQTNQQPFKMQLTTLLLPLLSTLALASPTLTPELNTRTVTGWSVRNFRSE